MFERYNAYIKDNPNGYWFRAKWYGWGWTPARWQGWLVLTVFIFLLVRNSLRIDELSHSVSDTLRPFFIQTVVMILALIWVCWKTGERPRWQWTPPSAGATGSEKNERPGPTQSYTSALIAFVIALALGFSFSIFFFGN